MLKKQILILCFLLCAYQSCQFEKIFEFGKALWLASTMLGNIKTNVDGTKSFFTELFLFQESQNAEIMEKLTQLSTQISKMQTQILLRLGEIQYLGEQLTYQLSTGSDKTNLRGYIVEIDDEYDEFLRNIKQKHNITLDVWNKFSIRAVPVIEKNIKLIYHLLTTTVNPHLPGGLIMTIATHTQKQGNNVCKDTQSVHHFVAQIVQLVMLTEMKALAILTAAYPFFYPAEIDSRIKISNARDDLEERFMVYMNTGLAAMKITPENLRACDPTDGGWIRDKTYFEIEGLQRTLIFNIGLERSSCAVSHLWPDMLEYEGVREEHACDGGTITNCDGFHYMLVCRRESGERLYEWVRNQEQRDYVFGMSQLYPECPKYGLAENVCNCTCNKNEENAISLALFEVDPDMVVTGAQLVRQNKTLYIRLKQGKLLADGQIDAKSQSWLPLPTNVSRKKYITTAQKRFFLSNPILPYGYALTGVRFLNQPEITLELIGQEFDYSNGTLLKHSIPIRPDPDAEADTYPSDRYPELKFPRHNSIYAKGVHIPDSGDHWIELQRSDMEYDVGQSVLPLFDSQPVETNPPSPLGGLGLFHKGMKGFAGFIALQLHSLRYKERVEEIIRNNKAGRIFGQ